MNKFWLICRYEYLRHVRRKALYICAAQYAGDGFADGRGRDFWRYGPNYDSRPVGYVDPTGFLANAQPVPQNSGELVPGSLRSIHIRMRPPPMAR